MSPTLLSCTPTFCFKILPPAVSKRSWWFRLMLFLIMKADMVDALNNRFTSERQLGQRSLENSSQAYDKQVLSKIGGPNTPTRTSGPGFLSSSAQETSSAPHTALSKLNGQLKPLSVPERLYPSLESPISRWTPSGAVSPAHSFDPGSDSYQRRYGSISTPGTLDDSSSSQQHRGSYDQSVFSEQEFTMEENGLRDLNINDRSPSGSDEYQLGSKCGLKRRASSPPSEAAREDRPTVGGGNDLYHRRSAQMLVNRNSPVSRFHANQGSLSSASSLSQRTGSFASSYGLSAASSATSYSGEPRLSPGALSPSTETEFGPVSPYAASSSLNPSPRGSLSRTHHQRGLSENEPTQHRKMSGDSLAHSRQNSVSNKIQGLFICECCPKKPKKFDSEEELRYVSSGAFTGRHIFDLAILHVKTNSPHQHPRAREAVHLPILPEPLQEQE